MPSLILLKSPGGITAQQTFPLDFRDKSEIVIGREKGKCDIFIDDGQHQISRRHAVLTTKNGNVYIENHARNGTFIKTRDISGLGPQLLKAEDSVKLCDFLFRFHDERPTLPKPLQDEFHSQSRYTPPMPETNLAGPRPAAAMTAGAQPVPDYMAPEQIHERADSPPSDATDLHAVGVMLFQVLTGELPFAPGVRDGGKLDAIVKRRFVSAVDWCQAKGVPSRTAPVIDQLLGGKVYRQARFLLQDLAGADRSPGPPIPPAPTPGEAFRITGFLYEDKLTEAFTAVGEGSGVPVCLRLFKPSYDTPDLERLIRGLVATPEEAPAGVLRRYATGRGQPIPVSPGVGFTVNPMAETGGCLSIVEEHPGDRTLMAAIQSGECVGEEAVVRVAVPLLEALHYFHQRGAIHGRLTPFCVFLPPAGGLKVEGLGLPAGAPAQRPARLPGGMHATVEEHRLAAENDDASGMTTIQGASRRATSPSAVNSQIADRLRLLLEMGVVFSRSVDAEDIGPQLAEALMRLFRQADRCMILEVGEGERLWTRATRSRVQGTNHTYSRELVRRSLETNQVLITPPTRGGETATDRWVMCAPLSAADGRPLGAILLDVFDRQVGSSELTAKFQSDDVQVLSIVAHSASVAMDRAVLLGVLVQREKAQREVELAKQVQLAFLPRAAPTLQGYEFFSHYSAAMSVGGDIYDYIPLPGDRLAIVIGDVAGKGIPSAMLMAKLSGMLPFCLLMEPQPERAVALLNDRLMQSGIGDRFVTLLLMVLNCRTHTVTVVNAGAQTPLLVRPPTRELTFLPDDLIGMPLGLMEGFEYAALSVTLGPGEVLVTFTDGVTDTADPDGTLFELTGVSASVLGDETAPLGPKEIGERLVAAVRKHAAGAPQGDDMAVVCFGRWPEGHP